jgi:4-hydroxybenzoate polyprenyltransferase
MKTIAAFFKLIRWPNLVFIALTQLLFYFFVYMPMLNTPVRANQHVLFYALVAASVLIAAAGYIINDYFDVQIDAINKPDRMVIGKTIKRRWAIILHWFFSGIGIGLSLYISNATHIWSIAIVNIISVFALWVYSSIFKKKLLIGNIIIAALTSWTLLVVYFFVGANIISLNAWNDSFNIFDERRFFKITLLYAGFAFIMTLIREVIKDLEDMEGDRKYDCKTMPIAWGVPAAKVFTAVWIVVAAVTLFVVQLYAWQSGRWVAALYFIVTTILPLFYLLKKFGTAITTADYATLSTIVKGIILAGILSMLFLKFGI